MKNRKVSVKSQIYTLVVLASLVLLFGSIVFAASGTISMQLKDLKTEGSKREDVPVYLYKVGTVDDQGSPSLDQKWGIEKYPKTSAELDKAAKKIAGKVPKTPEWETATDADGKAIFSDVEDGVYLIMVPDKNSYGKVSPFLLQVPSYLEVDGKLEGPIYAVEADPKAQPHGKDPGKPDKPDKHKSDKNPEPSPGSTPSPAISPKTGDTTPVELYVALLAAAVLGVVAFIFIRRRKS